MKSQTTPAWLEDAVFYEIYPQSFNDSNGDGIGDIPGITSKLDYFKHLGVTALWLNPCFESPFSDAGYDVSDYYKVAPRYGSNDDLKRLFDEARNMGIRVLLDLVPGHTSIEHPWFKQSCKHESNAYSDWYIWTDSVWKWDVPGYRVISGHAERDAAYITNFFYFQPALNYGFAHPDPTQPWQQPVDAPGPQAVRQELRKIMAFWLDMGASGFRVDMAMSLVKGDPGQVETMRLWQEMRTWLQGKYPDACLVSEWGRPNLAIQGGFHIDFTLPFAFPGYSSLLRKPYGKAEGQNPYGFSFFDSAGLGNIREFMDEYLQHYEATRGKGQIALLTGNHDITPRLSKGRTASDMALFYLFLLTMPGTPFIYYGDEIGMRTVEGLPSKEGGYQRTGSRTPMQWDDSPNAGFSTAPAAQLYLPIDPESDRPTAAAQHSDPNSLLNTVRKLILLRRKHIALCASADFEVVYAQAGKYPLVYRRTWKDETALIIINPSNRPVNLVLPDLGKKGCEVIYGASDSLQFWGDSWQVRLAGVSGAIWMLH
jgi:glycosidase